MQLYTEVDIFIDMSDITLNFYVVYKWSVKKIGNNFSLPIYLCCLKYKGRYIFHRDDPW